VSMTRDEWQTLERLCRQALEGEAVSGNAVA
jgi:hypothetical protein